MPQQSAAQERWESHHHAAFGNIKCSFKTRLNLVKLPQARRQPFDGCGRPSPHRGGTIRFSPLAFCARGYCRFAGLFFLAGVRTRPSRMAFCRVLGFKSRFLATSPSLSPPPQRPPISPPPPPPHPPPPPPPPRTKNPIL